MSKNGIHPFFSISWVVVVESLLFNDKEDQGLNPQFLLKGTVD